MLLPLLPQGLAACAFDSIGPGGWTTPPGRRTGGTSLLALEPEAVFRGGPEAIRDARRWLSESRGGEPFAAIVAGYLSYDLGRAFESGSRPLLQREPGLEEPVPEVHLAGFRAVYTYDVATRSAAVLGSSPAAVRRLAERIGSTAGIEDPPDPPKLPPPIVRSSDREFREGVRSIQRWIRAGDVYQVNLSRRLDVSPVAPDLAPALYRALTACSGAPFSSYVDSGSHLLISNSPERFLRVVDDHVETCPIKGTRPRGKAPAADRQLAEQLRHSSKDLAEHLMIVDLERNDLGRVCRIGSVDVTRFAELRSFANVHHLISSVEGRLRPQTDWLSLLAATFPGGSITGAPKLRAMQIIDELEPVRRGVYTGAIGYFDSAGGLDLSLAIRTAVASRGELHLHLGGGIVADSEPEDELRETRDKGAAFAPLWGGAKP